MLTMLSGTSKYFERTIIPILDSKPQELMNFIEWVLHPIASPPDLPKESRVSNFQRGSKEESLEFTSSPPPNVSCRRIISGCSESITLFRSGILRGPSKPLHLKEHHFIKAPSLWLTFL